MKRGQRVLRIVLTGAVVVTAAVLFWPRDREPVYQGKALSEWLVYDQPASIPLRAHDLQSEAITHIGTNALPWLLRWSRYEPSARVRKLTRFASRLNIDFHPEAGDVERASGAWLGLQILGPQGSAAIPELLQMATNSKSPNVASGASAALGWIGVEALPALLSVVTNQQAPARRQAILSAGAIENLGTNEILALPAILSCLQDRDFRVVGCAAVALGRMNAEPVRVVPAIAGCMNRPETFVRERAAYALGKFGQAARLAVPDLVNALNDSDISVRQNVTNALMAIAPEALGKR